MTPTSTTRTNNRLSSPRHRLLGTTRPEVIDGWAEIFQAMADSNRLRILLAVHYSPGINVTELAEAVGMTANATSHALAALRVRGIIRSERAGRERRWSIASEQIHACCTRSAPPTRRPAHSHCVGRHSDQRTRTYVASAARARWAIAATSAS